MPLAWKITSQCNLGRCAFCRASGSSGTGEAIDAHVIKDVCRQYSASNREDSRSKKIYFTGGEPFISRDCVRLLRYVAESLGLPVGVVTNGTLVTRQMAHGLAHPNVEVSVSLDGTGTIHDKMRGVRCFDRVAQAVDDLLSAGVIVDIHSTVTTTNIACLRSEEFVQLLRDRFKGIRQVALSRVDPLGRGVRCQRMNVTSSAFDDTRRSITRKLQGVPVIVRKPRLAFCRIDHAGNVYMLSEMAGNDAFYDGNVLCDHLDDILATPSFHRIFHSHSAHQHRLLWELIRALARVTRSKGKALAEVVTEALDRPCYVA